MPEDQPSSPPSHRPKHVLLVSPFVFSYHESICETLRSLGYEVTWWDERASSASIYKLALRLLPAWTRRWSERRFTQRLSQLDPAAISHVLIIKGEGISRKMVHLIRHKLSHASMGLYLWDGVENVRGASTILDAFDTVATFDPEDAARRHWTHRPLFARGSPGAQVAGPEMAYDWCFIGTLHSDRHRVIHRMRKRCAGRYRSFVFGYFPGKLARALRYLFDWSLWVAPKGSLSIKSMSASEVQAVVRSARAVFDVEHPRQRGLTMRTIETLLAGKKLITTNRHILDSDLYHPSRVHVISRQEPDLADDFLDSPFLPLPAELRRRYSSEAWITDLLDLQDAARHRTDLAATPPAMAASSGR